MSEVREAVQMDPGQAQLDDGRCKRETLKIVYRKYLRTRRRIGTLEGQFRSYNNLPFSEYL